MRDIATRLAIAALFALAVRAVNAQQPSPYAPQRRDPYAPQVQPPPVANQSLRYPLPTTGPAPNVQGQPAPGVTAPPVIAPVTSMSPIATPPFTRQAVLFAPGQIVARVGDKTILYADVAPTVAMRLEPFLAKARNPAERQAMEAAYRDPLTKHVIDQLVFNKMLLMEFERTMPPEVRSDPKKRAEAEGKMKKQIQRAFEESLASARERLANASEEELEAAMKQDSSVVRLALLMKQRHLESPGELDAALRQYGTSLDQQAKDFGEYMMGMEAAQTNLGLKDKGGKGGKPKKEITHQEMLDHYQAHINDYYIPAKARFEILTAKFSKFAGDRRATYDAVARMGNEVILGGTPFPAVARKHSQEPHASDGGYYDWVTPGSLASKPIDQAVFSLEVDKLSQIIEDDQGYHIVHVLERKPAGQVSFHEAQPEIRDAIKEQRAAAERQKYLTNLRARTKVWTIFDPPADGAGPPPSGPR